MAATLAPAQETTPTPSTVEEALHQMSDVAGVIFTGEVTAIRQLAGQSGASGLVEVDFRVDQAVRGCTAGTIYTLREWAGLWSGQPRYRVGQRLLMLLHPAPPGGGVSSPVGGMAGAIPIRGTSSAPGVVSSSTATSPEIADLRWVGTRLLRTIPTATSPVVTGSGGASTTSTASEDSIPAQQASVSTVLGMLRSWQQVAP
jgi:hypothetical protein